MPRRERRTVGIRLSPRFVLLVAVLVLTVFAAAACGRDSEGDADAADGGDTTAETQDVEALSGRIVSDGSSTVGPLTTAAAERFREEQPNVNIEVGISGTGGGFERFCAGETDVSNASRPIDEEEEVPICEENGIEYTELQVAVDALTVVVNPENDWAECLTVEQLNTMWGPEAEGEITNWSQVDPSFPDQQLSLAGPGTDSGTFDYFTDEVNGEEGASRSDYTASEDDNVIVQAVQGEPGAMGSFGFPYYEENEDTLKAVAVENEEGECVEPSAVATQDTTVGAQPAPIRLRAEGRRWGELAVKAGLALCAFVSIATTLGIVAARLEPSVEFFREISFGEFFTEERWAPLFTPSSFGIRPLLVGTLMVTVWACVVCMPFGLGAAVYLSEYARPRARRVLKPLLEVLAGIPTVVYGFFALTFFTPLLGDIGIEVGVFNVLSAAPVILGPPACRWRRGSSSRRRSRGSWPATSSRSHAPSARR